MRSLSACGQGTSGQSFPLERNGRYLPGFNTCRSSLRPWRASVQERFCKAANVAVMIVERRKELLVRGHVPFGAPLQMASE